jgi:hypothetical protein
MKSTFPPSSAILAAAAVNHPQPAENVSTFREFSKRASPSGSANAFLELLKWIELAFFGNDLNGA